MDDHLGVGGRTERVPAGLQIATQFLEVVDLAVEDDLDLAVLVAKRLVPGVQIDDRQSTMGQSDLHPAACGACGQESLVVRAAVGDRPRHPPQCGLGFDPVRNRANEACNTAHGSDSWVGRRRSDRWFVAPAPGRTPTC